MTFGGLLATIALTVVTVLVVHFFCFGSKTRSVVAKPLPETRKKPPLEISAELDTPISFGYKTCWLAIRTGDPQAVIEAIGLRDVQPANWKSGFVAVYGYDEKWAFVTPVIDGWVLVLDRTLPSPEEENGANDALMTNLSAKFAEVQFFGNHRVCDYVAWARYRNGTCLRSYSFVYETRHSRGEPTAEEKALAIPMPPAGSDTEGDHPDEDSVMQLAGAWSINPNQLEERAASLGPGLGWLGHRS